MESSPREVPAIVLSINVIGRSTLTQPEKAFFNVSYVKKVYLATYYINGSRLLGHTVLWERLISIPSNEPKVLNSL